MARFELQLKNFKIDVPNTGVTHDASHLYWAIKDNNQPKGLKYQDDEGNFNVFHGGALKDPNNPKLGIYKVGSPKQQVGFTDNNENFKNSIGTDDSTPVLKFNTEEQMQTVVQLIKFAGGAINDLGEKYAGLFDNSNSVAFFIGKALGFNDAQLEGCSNALDTGLVGKPGFNNDLSNGSNLDLDEVKEDSKKSLSEKQKEMFEELKSQIEHMSTEISYNNESNQDEVKVASEFGNTIGSIIRSNNEFSDLESLGLDISIDTLSHNIGELFTGDSYGFNDVLSDTGFEIAEGIGSYAISAYFTKNGSTAEFIGIDDNVAGGELINSYVNQYLSGITTDYLKDMGANRALDANYSLDGVDGLNIIAGMVGRYGAKDISGINSNTEAEAYGSSLGGAIGGVVGASFGGPIGATFGTWAGIAVGDSVGELFNDYNSLNDMSNIEDFGQFLVDGTFGLVSNSIGGLFGGDKKPEASISYTYDYAKDEYVITHESAKHGGSTKALKNIASSFEDSLENVNNAIGGIIVKDDAYMPDIKISMKGSRISINGRSGDVNDLINTLVVEHANNLLVEDGDSDVLKAIDKYSGDDLGDMFNLISTTSKYNAFASKASIFLDKDGEIITPNAKYGEDGELPQSERSDTLQSQLLGFGVASEDTNILRSNVSSGVRCLLLNGTKLQAHSIEFNNELDKLNANTSIKKVA